jgi:hypothetical protein
MLARIVQRIKSLANIIEKTQPLYGIDFIVEYKAQT